MNTDQGEALVGDALSCGNPALPMVNIVSCGTSHFILLGLNGVWGFGGEAPMQLSLRTMLPFVDSTIMFCESWVR